MARLIEWTGERCVPWAPDAAVIYEHYHRYRWAAELIAGRRVLDLGSGEGLGSALLAESAASVLGIDVDAATIEHSQARYRRDGLEFRVGSALDLAEMRADSFDAVVAFEMIEHVDDHERVLAGIDHVLAEDGILIMSTPDTAIYSAESGRENPFHVHELDESGFRALLASRFPHVTLWGQRMITGSRIRPLDAAATGPGLDVTIELRDGAWAFTDPSPPLYFVAVGSRRPLDTPPGDSQLNDAGSQIVRLKQRRIDELVAELDERARELAEMADEADALRERILGLANELEVTAANSAEGWSRYHTLRNRRAVRMALTAANTFARLGRRT